MQWYQFGITLITLKKTSPYWKSIWWGF